jgi:hypothetical protein
MVRALASSVPLLVQSVDTLAIGSISYFYLYVSDRQRVIFVAFGSRWHHLVPNLGQHALRDHPVSLVPCSCGQDTDSSQTGPQCLRRSSCSVSLKLDRKCEIVF